MKQTFWKINGETYRKVNKTQAEKLFNKGYSLTVCFANCNPNFIGCPLISIIKNEDTSEFTKVCTEYIHYNYIGGIGWKKYLWFFVKEKQREGQILLSDARGIYIPRDFCEGFADSLKKPLSEEDKEILSNPEHEYYWELWTNILDYNSIIDKDGEEWLLYQDGDLYAYHISEQENFFNTHSDF